MTNPYNTSIETQYPVGTIVNPNGTTTRKTKDTLDKDAFMKLLVAQMKFQNPMSPTDSTAFMQQSAQFSMLEALQNLQTEMQSTFRAQSSTIGLNMVGKKIVATPTTGNEDIVGVVTSVKLGTDGPVLKIGDMEVAMSQVKEVKSA